MANALGLSVLPGGKSKNLVADLRKSLGLTQEDFAKFCGISKMSISRYESGANIRQDIAQKIADACNSSVDYVLGRSPNASGFLPVSTKRIPILDEIHCGEPSFEDQDFEAYVEVGSKLQVDYALRAKGDSMIGARIYDGDLVFIRHQATVRNGEIAAVLIDDSTALKRVRFLPGNMILLQAENSAYEPIVIGGSCESREVRILGKAIAFQANIH